MQWETARPKLFEASQKYVDGLFITDEDDALPNWYGYSAAYHVVNAMLEDRTVHDLLQMAEETFIDHLDRFYGE